MWLWGKGQCEIIQSFICLLALGPICSLCVSSFGARPVTIFSGFMVAGGLMLSSFAPNIYFLFFSYGILVGKQLTVPGIFLSPGVTHHFINVCMMFVKMWRVKWLIDYLRSMTTFPNTDALVKYLPRVSGHLKGSTCLTIHTCKAHEGFPSQPLCWYSTRKGRRDKGNAT